MAYGRTYLCWWQATENPRLTSTSDVLASVKLHPYVSFKLATITESICSMKGSECTNLPGGPRQQSCGAPDLLALNGGSIKLTGNVHWPGAGGGR